MAAARFNPAAAANASSAPLGNGTSHIVDPHPFTELQAATKLGRCPTRVGGFTSARHTATSFDEEVFDASELDVGRKLSRRW